MNPRFIRLLLDPQGGEGNGATSTATQDGATGTSATNANGSGQGPDLVKAIEGLLSKHGDATAALRVLLNENHEYRDSIRDLKKRIPSPESRVLTGDEAKVWDAYATLGGVDDIRSALAERDEYKAKATGYERAEAVKSIASLYGFNAKVLGDRLGDGELPEIKEVVEHGKPMKRAFVKDAAGKDVDLAKHAESAWADYLPSLKPDKGGSLIPGTPGRRSPTPAPTPTQTTPGPARRMTL